MAVKRRAANFVLTVNPILCDGFGHCHELAPELVDMDEWGYPVLKSAPTPLQDASALASAHYAVRGCPRQALRIEKVSDDHTAH